MAKSDMHFLCRILILASIICVKLECLKGFVVEKYNIKSLSVLSRLHIAHGYYFINIIY
jgi:hypothetical protein